MLEKDIERYFVRRVKELGGIAYKFTSQGNAGVPDRIACLPNGDIVFVELKSPLGALTKLQERQIAKLKSLKAQVLVVKSKSDVDDFICTCLKRLNDYVV